MKNQWIFREIITIDKKYKESLLELMQIRCVFGLSCIKKIHLDGSDHLGCFVPSVKKITGDFAVSWCLKLWVYEAL